MKKLILITTILSSTAFGMDDLYIKSAISLNNMEDHKVSSNKFKGKDKHGMFPSLELAVGKQLNEDTRMELGLNYLFTPHSEEKTNGILADYNFNDVYVIQHKAHLGAVSLSMYKDLVTIDKFTGFIGAGAGIGLNKEKASGHVVNKDYAGLSERLESVSSKYSKRFIYKLTAGVDYKLQDNLKVEVSYSFVNLGKNKPKFIEGEYVPNKRGYKLHAMQLGLRWTI